jgi:hypothetical protein
VIRDLLVAVALLAGGAAVLPHVPLHNPDMAPSSAVSAVPASDTLEITAVHEAGHVAVLREFGIPVWHIEADEDGSGETTYPTGRDPYGYAVVDAAGQESAAAWLMQHRGYPLDRALAETESSARSDLADLRVDAARAGISEAQARQRARDIVRDHQAEIARAARQLIEHGGFLDERDLNQIDPDGSSS